MDKPRVAKSQRAVGNRRIEESGCEVIRSATTTLAVKGQVNVKKTVEEMG